MDELLTTVLKRPYVFGFLAAYLFLAWRRWGWRRTLLWLVSGYTIAWASEYASIHWNIPYGEYHYIYANLKGELLVTGVPFFDSLSYPFLIFAGYTMARERLFLGAFFTMLLDVVIDPVATMGDKWFLGQIHYYAHPGWYFGVPLTNFLGWFLVPLAVIVLNEWTWRKRSLQVGATGRSPLPWLYPVFYFSIALFNIAIAFWIGEWKLGMASTIMLGIPLSIVWAWDNRDG